MRRDPQSGQAMALGAVGLFVMALGILATLNIGQAVHDKIKLQNTADAAAYSLATLEARTFNFIAFTNRAQLVHYNAAMTLQSYLSYTNYVLAARATAHDMLADVALTYQRACQMPPPPPYNPWCPHVGPSQGVAQADEQIMNAIWQFYDIPLPISGIGAMSFDRAVHQAVDAMAQFNAQAVYPMQVARVALVYGHILTGMDKVIHDMDPRLSIGRGSNWPINMAFNAATNFIEFSGAFDPATGNMGILGPSTNYRPDPSDPAATEAMGIITEIANASRGHQDVFNRSTRYFTSIVTPTGIYAGTVVGAKKGQTKLTSDGTPQPEVSAIRTERPEDYPAADNVASDDYLDTGALVGSIPFLATVYYQTPSKIGDGIAARAQNGQHYKYDHTGFGGLTARAPTSELVSLPAPIGPATSTMKNAVDETSGVPWSGPAPYLSFNATQDQTKDYGQPSTWIFLSKTPHDMTLHDDVEQPWRQKFTYTEGERSASLDTTIGGSRNSILFQGLNVIARGQVYYHRPGVSGASHWAEQPNFFNPFWRARLAPVGQKLMNVWERAVGSNIQAGPAAGPVVTGAMNFLRNAQMDFFTRAVTSVMTH